jgi:hypothetical protein
VILWICELCSTVWNYSLNSNLFHIAFDPQLTSDKLASCCEHLTLSCHWEKLILVQNASCCMLGILIHILQLEKLHAWRFLILLQTTQFSSFFTVLSRSYSPSKSFMVIWCFIHLGRAAWRLPIYHISELLEVLEYKTVFVLVPGNTVHLSYLCVLYCNL